MELIVYAALISWAPISWILFALKPAQTAALACVVLGYLFLPQATIDLPGLPGALDAGKFNVIGLGLLAPLLVAGRRVRFGWVDVPMLAWCMVPIATSLSNGLGPWDGLSGVVRHTLTYGAPYLAGRAWLAGPDALDKLAKWIVLGGLLYVPLCVIELRLSPQLHAWVYGFHQHQFLQTIRGGGYRPVVFLQHGLAVALWMAVAAVVSLTASRRRGHVPGSRSVAMGLRTPVLVMTAAACHSLGAFLIMALAIGVVIFGTTGRSYVLVVALAMVAPVEIAARFVVPGGITGSLVSALDPAPERTASARYRLEADDRQLRRAMERPVLGWGTWGRNRVGLGRMASDSLWALIVGTHGLVGLLGHFGSLLLSQLGALRRLRTTPISNGANHAPLAIVIGLAMYQIDCVVNAMVNPVMYLAAGALVSFSRASGARAEGRPGGRASEGGQWT